MHVEATYSALFAFVHQNDPHTCLVRVCIGVRVMLSQLIVVAISDLHWVKLLLLTLLALCTALRSLVRHSHVIHTVM